MVGNVNNIVESMFAADNVRNQQSTANGKTDNFSGYLNSALLNYQTGLLTGGLNSGYSYMNALTGSAWQNVVLEALRDGLKKSRQTESAEEESDQESGVSSNEARKKSDWATIRVIRRYHAPVLEEENTKKGILV